MRCKKAACTQPVPRCQRAACTALIWHCGQALGASEDCLCAHLHAGQLGDGVEVDAPEVALVRDRRQLPPPA